MKALITGCAGFIGYHLSKKLLEENFHVTGIDNLNKYYDKKLKLLRLKRLKHKNFIFIEKDISNINSLKGKFDIVINLAAQAGVREKNKDVYNQTNIHGFEEVVRFCQKNDINNLLQASSSSVYGDIENKPSCESFSQLKPKSYYGYTKLHNEHYAKKQSKRDLKIICLRFFSVYGPYGRPDMAYFLFSQKLYNNEPITLFNDGQMSRDMTYIDDIVDGIVLSARYIFKSKTNFEIFNLGNSTPISTIKLLKALQSLLLKKTPINLEESTNESNATFADISKAKLMLGYSPKVSFDEGIVKFVKWFKEYEK